MGRPLRGLRRPSELVLFPSVRRETDSRFVVVFADGYAAATACRTRVNFVRNLFAEDRGLPRSAVANKLVIDSVGVMPSALVCSTC